MPNEKNNQPALPYWINQKTVQAAQIAVMERRPYDCSNVLTLRHPVSGEKIAMPVSDDYIDRYRPHVGGFYVRAEDGRETFAPAGQFESNFTLQRGSRIATVTLAPEELEEIRNEGVSASGMIVADILGTGQLSIPRFIDMDVAQDGVTMMPSPGVDIDRVHSVWGKGQKQPAFPTVASKVPNEN